MQLTPATISKATSKVGEYSAASPDAVNRPIALLSTGYTALGPDAANAWCRANEIAENSNGQFYSIAQTDIWTKLLGLPDGCRSVIDGVASEITKTDPNYTASTALIAVVEHILFSTGAYNFLDAASSNSLVICSTTPYQDCIHLSGEIVSFQAGAAPQ